MMKRYKISLLGLAILGLVPGQMSSMIKEEERPYPMAFQIIGVKNEMPCPVTIVKWFLRGPSGAPDLPLFVRKGGVEKPYIFRISNFETMQDIYMVMAGSEDVHYFKDPIVFFVSPLLKELWMLKHDSIVIFSGFTMASFSISPEKPGIISYSEADTMGHFIAGSEKTIPYQLGDKLVLHIKTDGSISLIKMLSEQDRQLIQDNITLLQQDQPEPVINNILNQKADFDRILGGEAVSQIMQAIFAKNMQQAIDVLQRSLK